MTRTVTILAVSWLLLPATVSARCIGRYQKTIRAHCRDGVPGDAPVACDADMQCDRQCSFDLPHYVEIYYSSVRVTVPVGKRRVAFIQNLPSGCYKYILRCAPHPKDAACP